MTKTKRLTTISYAVLGLLRLRPHSAYELAQQNARSGIFWSAADSVVYEEPKNLVAHGLATAVPDTSGSRPRTVYAITAKGRRELRRWLSCPRGSPQVQYEDMLRVLFADAGTTDDLLAVLASISEWARHSRANAQRIALDYLQGDAPYPDRAHIVQLTMGYQLSVANAVERWAEWARSQVDTWPAAASRDAGASDAFERYLGGWHPGQGLDLVPGPQTH